MLLVEGDRYTFIAYMKLVNACDLSEFITYTDGKLYGEVDCLFAALKMFLLNFFQVVTNVHFMENYLTQVDLDAKG